MSRRIPLSRHLALEVEHIAVHGPLEPDVPVPGCGCALCLTLDAGGTWEDGQVAREIVEALATLPPDDRVEMATGWQDGPAIVGRTLPAPSVLAALAALEPGAWQTPRRRSPARRRRPRPERPRLDVDAARRADILTTAQRLGLGEPRRAGSGEYRVRCPFHDDNDPSLTITPARGLFYCFVCDLGGDVIELVQRTRGTDFKDAVLELTGERRAA